MVIIFKCVFFVNTSSKFNVNIILDDFFLGKKESVFCRSGKIAVDNCTFPVCDWCECLSVAKQGVRSIMITVTIFHALNTITKLFF